MFPIAPPQRLILSVAGPNARVISPRYLVIFSTKFLCRTRLIHTPTDDSKSTLPKAKAKAKSLPSQQLKLPHQAQERSENLSVPGFNPPGGGGGSGPGGSNVFQLTRSPLFDAALTTIIGIGMGELHMLLKSGSTEWHCVSFFWRCCIYKVVQEECSWQGKHSSSATRFVYQLWNSSTKIEQAFSGGYDPALELAKEHTQRVPFEDSNSDSHGNYPASWSSNLRRKEQDFVDAIVQGMEPGHYFMLLGPKVFGNFAQVYNDSVQHRVLVKVVWSSSQWRTSRQRVLLFVMLIQILKFSAYASEKHSISSSLRIHKQGCFNEEIPAKVGIYIYKRLFAHSIRIKGDRVLILREVTTTIVSQVQLTDEVIL